MPKEKGFEESVNNSSKNPCRFGKEVETTEIKSISSPSKLYSIQSPLIDEDIAQRNRTKICLFASSFRLAHSRLA